MKLGSAETHRDSIQKHLDAEAARRDNYNLHRYSSIMRSKRGQRHLRPTDTRARCLSKFPITVRIPRASPTYSLR